MGLGQILGAVSLFAVIAQAFSLGLGSLMVQLLDYHDKLLSILLGWAEPPIRTLLFWVNSIFDWNLKLGNHWKHIAFLMSLYFGAYVWDALHRRFWRAAIFYAAAGISISILSALVAGLVLIGDTPSSFIWGNAIVASIPLLGVVAFSILTAYRAARWYRPKGKTFREQFRVLVAHPLRFLAVGAGAITLGTPLLALSLSGQGFGPAYSLILFLAAALAAYRVILRDAWQGGVVKAAQTVEEFRTSVIASGGARIGVRMSKAFLGAVMLIVLNTGQQLLGL